MCASCPTALDWTVQCLHVRGALHQGAECLEAAFPDASVSGADCCCWCCCCRIAERGCRAPERHHSGAIAAVTDSSCRQATQGLHVSASHCLCPRPSGISTGRFLPLSLLAAALNLHDALERDSLPCANASTLPCTAHVDLCNHRGDLTNPCLSHTNIVLVSAALLLTSSLHATGATCLCLTWPRSPCP